MMSFMLNQNLGALRLTRSTFSSGRAKNDSVVDRGFSWVVRVRIAASDDTSSEGRLDSSASRTNQVNAGVSSSAPEDRAVYMNRAGGSSRFFKAFISSSYSAIVFHLSVSPKLG